MSKTLREKDHIALNLWGRHLLYRFLLSTPLASEIRNLREIACKWVIVVRSTIDHFIDVAELPGYGWKQGCR